MIAALLLAVQGTALPTPVEAGFLPPMGFSCQLDGGGAALSGRISPVRINAGGMSLFQAADAGNNFKDRLRVEIIASPLPDLAGSYEVVALSPADVDKMVLPLPLKAGGGYSLTLYSPPSGHGGYPQFTHMLVERAHGPGASRAGGPSVWFAACTTNPPAKATKK